MALCSPCIFALKTVKLVLINFHIGNATMHQSKYPYDDGFWAWLIQTIADQRSITVSLGYHWLPLATIDLVHDYREFDVLGLF